MVIYHLLKKVSEVKKIKKNKPFESKSSIESSDAISESESLAEMDVCAECVGGDKPLPAVEVATTPLVVPVLVSAAVPDDPINL